MSSLPDLSAISDNLTSVVGGDIATAPDLFAFLTGDIVAMGPVGYFWAGAIAWLAGPYALFTTGAFVAALNLGLFGPFEDLALFAAQIAGALVLLHAVFTQTLGKRRAKRITASFGMIAIGLLSGFAIGWENLPSFITAPLS